MHSVVPMSADCWYLTGPTASGKTVVGVALARLIGAEIVSMDSMALYRGMDIGTAKPSPQQRAAVPHHLVDVLEPHQQFSLASYLAAADRAAEDIRNRGKQVLFVGGTPLYLKGLLRGIFHGPPADWQFRKRLQAEAARQPPGWLHQQLARVDPQAAARLHPNDTRRLIRALEVFTKTGTPISQLQQQFDKGAPADQRRVFVLDWPRDELYRRIEQRVDQMFAAGLVEEVQRLLGQVPPDQALPPDDSAELPAGEPPELRADDSPELYVDESPALLADESSAPRPDKSLALLPDESSLPRPGESPALLPDESLASDGQCCAGRLPAGGKELPQRVFSRTALQAVGYREVIEYLQGRRDLASTIALVKQRSRQLAKRQITWFRSLSECRFVPMSAQEDAERVAQAIAIAGQQCQ